MDKVKKWAQRAFFAVLVVWLIWLTVMQVYLNNRVQPLSQSDMLKEIVALQGQINTLQIEIDDIKGVPTDLVPFDKSELEN